MQENRHLDNAQFPNNNIIQSSSENGTGNGIISKVDAQLNQMCGPSFLVLLKRHV